MSLFNRSVTFGICTDGQNEDRLIACLHSIKDEMCSGDQIIVVGGKWDGPFIWIPFDESIKPGWITKKKNLITQCSSTDFIVYMHDYVALEPGWRDGFERFTDENPIWITATNQIINADGQRFRDWCAIFNDAWMEPPIDNQKPPYNTDGNLLQYNNNTMGRWQYYSGAYFCTDRTIMLEIPLNEERVWGQGEDVEWCRKLYKRYGQSAFSFNKYSRVQFLKQKTKAPWEAFSPL